MDVLAYWSTIRRQRRIVLLGVVLSVLVALFAALEFTSSGVRYRSPATYVAGSTLLVTQDGFPWGRSALTEYVRARGTSERLSIPRFAEPARMEYLAALYTEFAQSDPVRNAVLPRGSSSTDDYTSTTLRAPDGRTLPLIEISATSHDPERAVQLAQKATTALRAYVGENQRTNAVPEEDRVAIPVVTRPDEAEVLRGPRRTPAIMLLLLGVVATIVVAFVRDNATRGAVTAEGLHGASGAPATGGSVATMTPVDGRSQGDGGQVLRPEKTVRGTQADSSEAATVRSSRWAPRREASGE